MVTNVTEHNKNREIGRNGNNKSKKGFYMNYRNCNKKGQKGIIQN